MNHSTANSRSDAFPRPGLTYFWFLNSDCRAEDIDRQLGEFARANVGAVVLHARPGLLIPYASGEWFSFIRTLAEKCVKLGVQPWLYDEDYCPSGSAGGWITVEHADLRTHAIERFVAPRDLAEGELFFFPSGKLLWAGLVPPVGAKVESIDLTEQVGLIRRHWEASPWDSRWFYPATPKYPCPLSSVYLPEFAIRRGKIRDGWTLEAYVARPAGKDSSYGALADSLNPVATQKFIERTHEKYHQYLGDMLGREIPAIFTDEPKFHASCPWTPGIFESFVETFGYDLRQRLPHLFDTSSQPDAMLTRLHYRQWCTDRFVDAWLNPIGEWCRRHNLALVGHISPEDDPVQQAMTCGNLFSLQENFDLVGIDLIIPAVGDAAHPMINVGVTTAVSAAQQMRKVGVMSEMLAASGLELSGAEAARILAWQVVSGVSAIVVHAAFASTLGLRRLDAPPDFGPDSPRWPAMVQIDRELRPFQDAVGAGSAQIAPVAILWPIRSFHAAGVPWQAEEPGLRGDLNRLLLACLQSQIGTHFIDEKQLIDAELRDGRVIVGNATYSAILVPSMTVIGAATIEKLTTLQHSGFKVYAMGDEPQWSIESSAVKPIRAKPWTRIQTTDLRSWCQKTLPRVLNLQGDNCAEIRASGWRKDDQTRYLLINIGRETCAALLDDFRFELRAGELIELSQDSEQRWSIKHRFDTADVASPTKSEYIECDNWAIRWADQTWQEVDRPRAVYQLCTPPLGGKGAIEMVLTSAAPLDDRPVAAHLEYRASFTLADKPAFAVLLLEPTAHRGDFSVRVAGKEWHAIVSDTQSVAHQIDLSDVVTPGVNEILFRIENPVSFDGIKTSPRIRVKAR